MDTVSVRLPGSLAQEIDAYAEDLKAQMPLLMISRADAVRQLLDLGLTEWRKGRKSRAAKSATSKS